jgi:F-type H+/Na+-transporting ATPase subunit beta
MGAYWVYEDMVVHPATVHQADCRYCNDGAGMGRGRIESDSHWLGPYKSARVAKQAPVRVNSMFRNCGVCCGGPCPPAHGRGYRHRAGFLESHFQ